MRRPFPVRKSQGSSFAQVLQVSTHLGFCGGLVDQHQILLSEVAGGVDDLLCPLACTAQHGKAGTEGCTITAGRATEEVHTLASQEQVYACIQRGPRGGACGSLAHWLHRSVLCTNCSRSVVKWLEHRGHVFDTHLTYGGEVTTLQHAVMPDQGHDDSNIFWVCAHVCQHTQVCVL